MEQEEEEEDYYKEQVLLTALGLTHSKLEVVALIHMVALGQTLPYKPTAMEQY